MIPTKQTILHDPLNGKHGNCLSAVLASLLHLSIDEVPIFSKPYPLWQQELNLWLRQYGLAYLQLGGFDEWCKVYAIEGCYCEVAGNTTRSIDVLHACVGVDGVQIFDPHPDNTGIVDVQSSGVFIALEPWRMLQPVAQEVVVNPIASGLDRDTSGMIGQP